MALFKPDLVLRANSSVARPRMGCEDGLLQEKIGAADAPRDDGLAPIELTGLDRMKVRTGHDQA